MGVLGSMFLSSEAVEMAQDRLSGREFYKLAHQDIFRAMMAITEKKARIDIVLLRNELTRQGLLEKSGGVRYLQELMEAVPTSTNVEYYIAIVSEHAARRDVLKLRPLINQVYNEDVETILAEIERFIDNSHTIAAEIIPPTFDAIREATEYMEAAREGKLRFISTGLYQLDRKLGGLKPGMLSILAGRPGDGKTTLLLNILIHACIRNNIPCLFFSAEMPRYQIITNMVRAMTSIDYSDFVKHTFTASNYEKWADAVMKIEDAPLLLDATSGIGIDILKRRAANAVKRDRVQFIGVDYIQCLGADKTLARNQQVAYIVQELKKLAGRHNCHVMALSQIARMSPENPTPRLKWSGEQEEAADLVLRLSHDKRYDNPDNNEREPVIAERRLYIEKHRHGPVGVVPLMFHKDVAQFREATYDRTGEG